MRVAALAAIALASGLVHADASASVASASAALSDRLSSLWEAVTPYIPTKVPAVSSSTSSGAVVQKVANLTAQNWNETLSSGSDKPWLIVITGGNQTCHGQCRQLNAAWTLASTALAADRSAPRLGFVDCEYNRLLCATWGATPATAWWVEKPQTRASVDKNGLPTFTNDRDVYVVKLNTTTVGADDIARLYRKKEYKSAGSLYEKESLLSRQPFDSKLAQFGLLQYVGYVYFAVGMVPSWTFIMILSITMRLFLQQKANTRETPQQKAERERKEKFTSDGKVRGAPPGDGTTY